VIASAAYPVIAGLQQVVTGHWHIRSSGFASDVGPFSHPNGFASFLVIAMVLTVVAFMHSRELWQRIALGLLLAGGLICLLFTYTRASWVGFAIAIVLLGVIRYRRLLVIGLVAVLVAAAAAPGTTKRAEQRFADLSSQAESHNRNSWSWRTKQWGGMVPWGLERPVFGRGFGSYQRDTLIVYGTHDRGLSTLPQKPNGAYGFGAHNDFVKTLVETGIVGVALWILTLVGVMSTAGGAIRVRSISPWATAIFAAAVALTFVSLTDNIQAAAVDMIYLFALAGAVAGAAARVRRARSPEVGVASAPVEEPAAEEPLPPAEPAVAPEPAPAPVAPGIRAEAPALRARVGRWLRRRLD
jgi:O-antigen ligase